MHTENEKNNIIERMIFNYNKKYIKWLIASTHWTGYFNRIPRCITVRTNVMLTSIICMYLRIRNTYWTFIF